MNLFPLITPATILCANEKKHIQDNNNIQVLYTYYILAKANISRIVLS